MPLGDSPLQPIIMTPTQIIRPSPLLKGADSSTVGPREETRDPFVGEDTSIKVITGIPYSNTHDSGEGGGNRIIQGLIMRLEHLESSNLALRKEVGELTNRVAKIEEENYL
jgi:hypothetical protein